MSSLPSPFRQVAFSLSLPAWVSKMFIGTKRNHVRHYVETNMEHNQVSFNRAQEVRFAAKSMLKTRSAFDSARQAWKTEYQLRRLAP